MLLASLAFALASAARAGTIVALDRNGDCVAVAAGSAEREYRSYNGTCNNAVNPTWGSSGPVWADGGVTAAGVPLQRLDNAQAYYRDPETLPSTRAISNAVSAQTTLVPNANGVSAMLMQWGQFLDHDIDLTPAGEEAWNIPVAKNDPQFGGLYGENGMPFHRSEYVPGTVNPREQINVITAFIDASQIYGSDAATASSLRVENSYLLKMDANGLLSKMTDPMTGQEVFFSGDERVREQVGLTSMHTLFSREHNRLAKDIADANSAYDDETVFQETRKLVGAMMQSITINEFLPALLGIHAPAPYDPLIHAYGPTVNPGIFNEFSTAAYRFGHSTLAPELLRLDDDFLPLAEGPLPLKDAFFNAEYLIDPTHPGGQGVGIEPYLRGLVTQPAQEVDTMIVDGLRNLLFGPMGFDLAALNMQRGRDHGLPTYNQLRGVLGLPTYSGWDDADLAFSDDVIAALTGVYGMEGFDDLDPWIGGLAEPHVDGGMVGELFSAIIAGQFERLRIGDRFWFEHDGMFEDEWMTFIQRSTLGAIMARNGIPGVQANVFFVIPAPGVLLLISSGLVGLRLQRRRTVRATGGAAPDWPQPT